MSLSRPVEPDGASAPAAGPRASPSTTRPPKKWVREGKKWYLVDCSSPTKINDPSECVTIDDLYQDEIRPMLEGTIPPPLLPRLQACHCRTVAFRRRSLPACTVPYRVVQVGRNIVATVIVTASKQMLLNLC